VSDTWWVRPDQLDEDQREVITRPIDESRLIFGPPGSGKTNLLLLKASQLVRTGKPNVLILTFTRALREFVSHGVNNYAFSEEKVKTFKAWMSEFLRGEGVEPDSTIDFDQQRRNRTKQCIDLLNLRGYGLMFDAIFIDEGQDCLPEEVELFSRLSEVLFVVADDKQKIYDTPDCVSFLKNKIPAAQTTRLRFHYRSGVNICRTADSIIAAAGENRLLPTCQYSEKENPSSVDVVRKDSLQNQVQYAIEELKDQLLAYPDEMLGIVCPKRQSLDDVVNMLVESDLSEECNFHVNDGDGYEPLDPSKRIYVSTIHSAKGLEFRALHILDAGSINFGSVRRVAYTAVTRAKTSLSIYHDGRIPPFLHSAAIAGQEPVEQASLEDLFKGVNS